LAARVQQALALPTKKEAEVSGSSGYSEFFIGHEFASGKLPTPD